MLFRFEINHRTHRAAVKTVWVVADDFFSATKIIEQTHRHWDVIAITRIQEEVIVP